MSVTRATMCAMATYVGFLRAINLGATRKFGKDAIVAATEGAGFTGVATHINTGNVRLETRMRSRARIEDALERAYRDDRGFAVPTMVVTAAELVAIGDDVDRLGAGHEGRQFVTLLKHDPDPEAVAALEARSTDLERVVVVGRVAHLLVGDDYLASSLAPAIEKALGVGTSRNVTVIRALVKKWC